LSKRVGRETSRTQQQQLLANVNNQMINGCGTTNKTETDNKSTSNSAITIIVDRGWHAWLKSKKSKAKKIK
jgi:hypothetical protein